MNTWWELECLFSRQVVQNLALELEDIGIPMRQESSNFIQDFETCYHRDGIVGIFDMSVKIFVEHGDFGIVETSKIGIHLDP